MSENCEICPLLFPAAQVSIFQYFDQHSKTPTCLQFTKKKKHYESGKCSDISNIREAATSETFVKIINKLINYQNCRQLLFCHVKLPCTKAGLRP